MINDLTELKKLLQLCRKQGVTELKFGGVELKLGELPQEPTQAQQELDPADPYANFPSGELTPDQLAFYSSGGLPEQDPYRTDQ